MPNFTSSTATVIELRFFMKMKVKNENHAVYLYFIPREIFSANFWHAVTFLHVLHLHVLKRQIEIETKSVSWL